MMSTTYIVSTLLCNPSPSRCNGSVLPAKTLRRKKSNSNPKCKRNPRRDEEDRLLLRNQSHPKWKTQCFQREGAGADRPRSLSRKLRMRTNQSSRGNAADRPKRRVFPRLRRRPKLLLRSSRTSGRRNVVGHQRIRILVRALRTRR